MEREIYERIREEILEGDRGPGDTLVEAQIAELFGVSKTPVREALIRLEREGLAVSSSSHRSIRVIEPTDDEVNQIYDIRCWVEASVAAMLARTGSPDVVKRLSDNIDRTRQALENGQRSAARRGVSDFTDIMVAATGNRFALDWLNRLRGVLAIVASASRRTPGRIEQSLAEHEAILGAIEAGDEQAAADAVRSHLESLRERSLAGLTAAGEVSSTPAAPSRRRSAAASRRRSAAASAADDG